MGKLRINNRIIGEGKPVYIIAEMSANHNQDIETALKIIEVAKDAGADAVKLQTYSADTMTINCRNEHFLLKDTLWKGQTLYDLYTKASTPWEWYPELKAKARETGIDIFSTPFDHTAVDFLEKMEAPVYKIASFEIVDIPLLKRVAQTKKPVILSTGMASFHEINEAVNTLKSTGCKELALLKCTSAYPASPEEANLKTIPDIADRFKVAAGLSDHTMGSTVAIGAVALGAAIIEKHFTLSRSVHGPDSSFSMEPDEFKTMVEDIRVLEKALGKISYEISDEQKQSLVFRRSLFAVKNIAKNESFTQDNIRSIRPGYGLHTRNFEKIVGRSALTNIKKGTPLTWQMIEK